MSDATYQTPIYQAQGGAELHVSSNGRLVVDPGGSVLVQGSVPLDFSRARTISSTAGEGFSSANLGYLSSGTDPIYAVVSTVDRTMRCQWTSASVVGIQFPTIPIPPDFSTVNGVTVQLLAGKPSSSGSTATRFDVRFWAGIGETESGTVTANVTSSTPGLFTVDIPATALIAASAGGAWTVNIVPSTHDVDPIYIHTAQINYTRSS